MTFTFFSSSLRTNDISLLCGLSVCLCINHHSRSRSRSRPSLTYFFARSVFNIRYLHLSHACIHVRSYYGIWYMGHGGCYSLARSSSFPPLAAFSIPLPSYLSCPVRFPLSFSLFDLIECCDLARTERNEIVMDGDGDKVVIVIPPCKQSKSIKQTNKQTNRSLPSLLFPSLNYALVVVVK